MPAKTLNVKKLLDHLGGITEVHAALTAGGCAVKRQAVAKWQERGRVPGAHLLQLIDHAKKRDRAFDIAKFQTTTNAHNPRRTA